MSELKKMFWSGEFSKLLLSLEDHKEESISGKDSPALIGALVFSGAFDKALVEHERCKAGLSPEEHSEVLFYLVVGFVRKSFYRQAFKILKENPRDDFYFYQSVAFYTYYRSDFNKSVKWAKRSLKRALLGQYKFGELLARDMLGGAYIHIGEVHLGLKELEEALDIAGSLGNGSFVEALKVSIVGVRSQFGLFKDPVKEIFDALKEIHPEDDYSLSDLNLELSRQLMLMGRVDEAEKVLNQTAPLIYRAQNKRQSSTFHQRLALMMYARGLSQQALTLLQVSEQSLNSRLDQVYLSRLRGFRRKILMELQMPESGVQEHLKSDAVGDRIQARPSGGKWSGRKGEDLAGDAIDRMFAQSKEEAVQTLIEKRFWFFLPNILNLSRESECIIFGLKRGSITLYSKGNVIHIDSDKKSLNTALLSEISKSFGSKKLLVERVWGYEYDPLRHDSLIYGAISGLRKSLGAFSHWLEVNEDGYSLRSGVRFMEYTSYVERTYAAPVSSKDTGSVVRSDERLNFRQSEWMSHSRSGKFFSIQDYSRYFDVSHMTAYRDLVQLLKEKVIFKRGYGRATRYCRTAT